MIGAGSIGARHRFALEGLGNEVAFVSARTDLDAPVFADIAQALAAFDAEYVVIANETALHSTAVRDLASAGYSGTLLVEKPLAVDVAALETFSRVGVGFNLRFHPVLAALVSAAADAQVFTAEAYVGQALASWRPGRPTGEQYSAVRARGGGVLRDLSHELDYLGWMLGACHGVFARGGRLSDVTVDADDAWGIVAEFDRAPVVTLQLNYLDTHTRRRVVLNTSRGTMAADLVANTLRIGDDEQAFDVDRNASYRAMHAAMLSGSADGVASPLAAGYTDELIGMIERSAASGEWVGR